MQNVRSNDEMVCVLNVTLFYGVLRHTQNFEIFTISIFLKCVATFEKGTR
jgi:hypothetical protein